MLRGQILKAPRSRLEQSHEVDEVKASGTVQVYCVEQTVNL